LSFVLVSLTQRNSPIHPVRYLDLRSIRASLIVALIRGSINLDPRPTASIGTSDLYDFAYRLIKSMLRVMLQNYKVGSRIHVIIKITIIK
ncbi:MAG: hypothetical protein QXN83_03735, partial [Nitrososphaerales archaeon]